MRRTGLEGLPLEVSEQILTSLDHQDILRTRLVSRTLNYVATRETYKYVYYPVSDPPEGDSKSRQRRRVLDEDARVHATRLLVDADKAFAIRKFTLGVLDEADHYPSDPLDDVVAAARVEVIANWLTQARNLRYLVIHTRSNIALPILKQLSEKIERLRLVGGPTLPSLAYSRLQCLTLRLVHHVLGYNKGVDTLPPLPLLSRLKVESEWSQEDWDEPASARCNFEQYPKLTWLKLCGRAPPQYLDTYEGHTTTLERLVIGDDRATDMSGLNFSGREASTFFARLSKGLEALIIYNGRFRTVIHSVFPKLRSLKIFTSMETYSFKRFKIIDCPQLTQLSIVNRCRRSKDLSWFAKSLLRNYSSTLRSIQLIKDPFDFDDDNGRRYLEELDKETICELGYCNDLKFLELSGFLYMSEKRARLLGKNLGKVEAVIQTFPRFGPYYHEVVDDEYQERLVARPITGLQITKRSKGQKLFAPRATSIHYSKPSSTWGDYMCPCGWTQRTHFARHLDPDSLFVDEDDEIDCEHGFTFQKDDETHHVIMDRKINESVLQVERERAEVVVSDEG